MRLAGSPAYPNQAFRFENAYGVQFHLEVSSDMAREWADVPEYADALEQTIGGRDDPRAPSTSAPVRCCELGRMLFERWLDHVSEILYPLNAVDLEV